jgi:ribosomal protein L35AE/L33A
MEPVRITATSGRIQVTAEDRSDVAIEGGQAHPMGGVLELKGSSSGIAARVPVGTDLVIGSHSGAVELRGDLGAVRITTRSGAVRVERCRDLDARTVSGRVEVGMVTGDARIRAASGRVAIERVEGDLAVTSVSGRVEVGEVVGALHATTVQGRIEAGLVGAASARCESVSGGISISVPSGVRPRTSLRAVSGRCVCEVPEGDDCDVVGRSVSGKIVVRARD